jgi:hypothetical protein
MFPGPPGEIDRWAETRLLRQQVLTRDPPLKYLGQRQAASHSRLKPAKALRYGTGTVI